MFRIEQPSLLTSREQTLLRLLQRAYTPAIARDVLLPLLYQTSPVSLRALDWAVVNWSKQHNVVCPARVGGMGEMTNVYNSYRSALHFWKRRLFDPFRRRTRITIEVDGARHETTLGQANFALWTYQTGVLAYVLTHIQAIEHDMNRVTQMQKQERRKAARAGTRRLRCELTPPNRVACLAYRAPIRVSFGSEDAST